MAYVKQEWKNLPNQTTPVNATRMEHIEQGIYDNSVAISNIIESGSNSNGKWIKYSDGTMFCWMRAEKTVDYQASGALYVGYLTGIVFPQTFTSEYTPMCFAQNNGLNEIITGQIEGVSATGITRVQCWKTIPASTYTILTVLAIGKWK